MPQHAISSKVSVTLTDYSQTLGSSAVQILPPLNGLSYERIWNVSATDGPTVWLSRFVTNPTPNGAGCFPLAPGAFDQFTLPGAVPSNPLYAYGPGATLTVEAG